MNISLHISARRFTLFLLAIGCCLFVLSLAVSLASVTLNTDSKTLQAVLDKFNVDLEGNVPTMYSSVMLLCAALFMFMIASHKKGERDPFTRHWFALGLIFTLMAIDEASSIHELIIPINEIFQFSGFLRFAWVIPGALFVLIFAFSFLRFVRHLPPATRNLMIAAGIVYVSGALLSESVGGYLFQTYGAKSVIYTLETQIEELLEIIGLVILIYTLTSYIEKHISLLQVNLEQRRPS